MLILITLLSTILNAQTSSSEYVESGKQKINIRNFSGAIQDFTKAIELDNQNELAYVNRALCRMTSGSWALAIPDCNKAISINPNQAVAYFVRGCAKANIQKNGCADLRKSLDLGYPQAQMGLNRYCN